MTGDPRPADEADEKRAGAAGRGAGATAADRPRALLVDCVAPAKVNLTLAVVGRRADGYHDLHSVMVPLDLADRVVISRAFGPADRLHVLGAGGAPAPDLGPPEANLALRAIAVAREALRAAGDAHPHPALAVRLEKRVPAAAGLAGGSSDGAAAFEGALRAWDATDVLAPGARAAAALALGSDCPFFLAGGWALVEGRGERVAPLPAPRGELPGLLVVTPAVPVATPAVFARYAAGVRPTPGAALATSSHFAGELAGGLTGTRFLERAGLLAVANDLAPATAALVAGLVAARRALARLLGRPVGQSGSGPTLWALYPSKVAAEEGAERVREALAGGLLPMPGAQPPFVAAAAIVGGAASMTAPSTGQPPAG